MSFRVIGGPYGNALTQAGSVALNPADVVEDNPTSYLYDGPGKNACMFVAGAGAGAISIDLNQVVEGDGGDGSELTGWEDKSGSGATVESSDEQFLSGTHSLKVSDASGGGAVEQDVIVRAGLRYGIKPAIYRDGTTLRIQVQNLRTGRYLKSDGTWNDVTQNLVNAGSDTGSWVTLNSGAGLEFVVESAALCLTETPELRIYLLITGTGHGYFECLLYRGIDFAMVAGGHNLLPGSVVLTDGTVILTLTVARDQFWLLNDRAVCSRTWTFSPTSGWLRGTEGEPGFVGDLILGQSITLTKTPMPTLKLAYSWDGQARLRGAAGANYVANRTRAPLRRLSLSFRYGTAAQEAEALAVWIEGARGGEEPIVVIPSTVKYPRLAVYGLIGPEVALDLDLQGARQDGSAGGDLGGEAFTQEHYSDLQIVVEEGPVFELD